jgi:hypothetical protein
LECAAPVKVLPPFDTCDDESFHGTPPYGQIRHEFEQAGQTIGAMDLQIRAHAFGLDATLVTNHLAPLPARPRPEGHRLASNRSV